MHTPSFPSCPFSLSWDVTDSPLRSIFRAWSADLGGPEEPGRSWILLHDRGGGRRPAAGEREARRRVHRDLGGEGAQGRLHPPAKVGNAGCFHFMEDNHQGGGVCRDGGGNQGGRQHSWILPTKENSSLGQPQSRLFSIRMSSLLFEGGTFTFERGFIIKYFFLGGNHQNRLPWGKHTTRHPACWIAHHQRTLCLWEQRRWGDLQWEKNIQHL